MQITLTGDDPQLMDFLAADLANDLAIIGIDGNIHIADIQHHPLNAPTKGGDPITLTTIVLAAVGAGGALTVAMSKEGFLTRLAQVLEKYVERRIEVEIDHGGGQRTRLSGPAGQIRKLLQENQTPPNDGQC